MDRPHSKSQKISINNSARQLMYDLHHRPRLNILHLDIPVYVVNINSPLNYDIDFGESDFEIKDHAISQSYIYEEIDLETGEIIDTQTSYTYRCRLHGLQKRIVHNDQGKVQTINSDDICRELFFLLFRSHGFVKCDIHGVDKYQRLVVDIRIELPDGQEINIADYLENFYPYFHHSSFTTKMFHNSSNEKSESKKKFTTWQKKKKRCEIISTKMSTGESKKSMKLNPHLNIPDQKFLPSFPRNFKSFNEQNGFKVRGRSDSENWRL